jgi:hypothetical protein
MAWETVTPPGCLLAPYGSIPIGFHVACADASGLEWLPTIVHHDVDVADDGAFAHLADAMQVFAIVTAVIDLDTDPASLRHRRIVPFAAHASSCALSL